MSYVPASQNFLNSSKCLIMAVGGILLHLKITSPLSFPSYLSYLSPSLAMAPIFPAMYTEFNISYGAVILCYFNTPTLISGVFVLTKQSHSIPYSLLRAHWPWTSNWSATFLHLYMCGLFGLFTDFLSVAFTSSPDGDIELCSWLSTNYVFCHKTKYITMTSFERHVNYMFVRI